MKRVCVFAGSSPGNDPRFLDAARELGAALAQRGVELVYGGANVGLMGAMANAVLEGGGHVIGVIPRHLLDFEVAHTGIPDLRIVESMHERKALMAELSDAFVALPGGFGTLEETFEVLTWRQLGLHQKPVVILNAGGYFDALVAFLEHMVKRRLLSPENHALLSVETSIEEMFAALEREATEGGGKWLDRDLT
ncbi:MAG: TIGR00730 family Rossman fold protein [Dehalococcoidia bacterium]|nr:TIGR00730 family Rossman fold protein [Dehalococcoidia bacterium]MBK9545061.1 TIGR00730 family Rossman fold protein [Dehalococcoidia bacterium]MBK9611149.1 TIGR00730 family Rossman fold protein [Dehalococcoidia bacterium]MCC6267235.1 TIGR00730 family Rossman fold protein [Dehalococcoidia bacterium]